MAVVTANLNKYASAGDIYVFPDKPADAAFMSHTAGVPAGSHTRHVGGTIGEAVVEYRPTIATADIEQVFGPVAPRLTAESATMKATLAEATWRNVELALQQADIHNLLADKNSSFETGSPVADNWVSVGTITPTIQTVNALAYGTKSQRFVSAAVPSSGIVSANFIEHPTIAPGAILVFSIYAKAATGTPNLNLKIEAFDTAGLTLGSNNSTSATTAAFARYSVAYTLPALTAKVKVTAQDLTGAAITLDLDQAQLETVDAGSTPTPYVPHKVLFVGGGTKVTTYPVVVISRQTDAAFYNWIMFYSAVASEGASIPFKRGNTRQVAVSFMALPDLTRAVNDQLLQIVEEK